MAYRTLDPRYTLLYIPIRVLYHTKLRTLFSISSYHSHLSMLTTNITILANSSSLVLWSNRGLAHIFPNRISSIQFNCFELLWIPPAFEFLTMSPSLSLVSQAPFCARLSLRQHMAELHLQWYRLLLNLNENNSHHQPSLGDAQISL